MIAIIGYNAGNSTSVKDALDRLGVESIVTSNVEQIQSAEKAIFPGVGHAGSAMQFLQKQGLDQVIRSLTQPVLGICLGMQLLCNHSEEENTNCLGIINAEVKAFPTDKPVPHMGWNNFSQCSGKLFYNVEPEDDVYFVHSYYVPLCENTIATTEYGLLYSAALQKDNFYATQFHVEKSGSVGEQILKNFLSF